MIVLNDDLFIFSLSYLVYFIGMGVISTISFTATGLFSISMALKNKNQDKQLSAASVSGFVESLISGLMNLVTQAGIYVFRTLLWLFPFLVIIVILHAVHENYPTLLHYLESAYNKFVAQTAAVSAIRNGAWFFKISAEVLIPLWNFFIDTGKRILINLMKLVLNDLDAKEYVTEIILNLGLAISGASSAIFHWMKASWECRFFKWGGDANILVPESVSCLDFENRELKLEDSIFNLQYAVSSIIELSTQLCPIGLGFIEVATYPLKKRTLGRILSAIVNIGLQVVWDMWDTTQLRCRLALENHHSLFYCIPDARPIFFYAKRGVLDTGDLLDDWIQAANDALFGLFLRRTEQATVLVGEEMLTQGDIAAHFSTHQYAVVRMNEYTVVYTDGAKIIWRAPVSTGNRVQEAAFRPAIDLRHGLAPISFQQTADEVDYDGEDRTSLMGCSCAMVNARVRIQCSVSVFSLTSGPELDSEERTHAIDVHFENSLSADYLSCDAIQISVQPVRFPQISAEENDDRLESREFAFASPARECMQDSRKCNSVDAVVYVKPLCIRAKSFKYNGDAQSTINKNRVACVEGSRFSSCFPYCLAMHHRGSGSNPMTLYGKRTIEGGVWRTNARCSLSGDELLLSLDSDKETPNLQEATGMLTRRTSSGSESVCRPLELNSAVQTNLAATNTSDLVPLEREREMIGFEWAWEQPVAFAGDSIIVPSCSIQNGECVWTTSVMRLTSTILGRYEVRESINKIPSESASSGWQLDRSTTSHVIRIPYATSDVFADRNLGVQTRTGFFYGVNPDLEVIPQTYLQDCYDEGSVTSIDVDGNFRSSRLFLSRPLYECSRGELLLERNQLFYDDLLARSCSGNLTREVVFDGDDRFWSAENIQSPTRNNLFIESVSYFDELNVMVAVRHGFLRYIKHDVGLRLPDDPQCPYPEPERSETRIYFVHTRTLALRRDRPWSVNRIAKTDRLVPDIMTLVAKNILIGVETTELVVNRYMLNLFGILEQKFYGEGENDVGFLLHHGAYENTHLPLSVKPIAKQIVNMYSHMDLTVLKTFRYLSLFIGLDPNVAHWSHNAVIAAINLATSAALTGFMALSFLWDEILLRFVDENIRASQNNIILTVFRAISNLVFDSLENNQMKNIVFGPALMFCNRLPHVTLDSGGPLGQTAFHACRAVVEVYYAGVRTFSTMVVFSDASNCICSVENRQDVSECLEIMPDSIQEHYRAYWSDKDPRNNQQRFDMCAGMVDIFRANLLDMPSKALKHVDLALMAMNNVPSEVAEYFGMDSELGQICTESAFDSMQQLTTITPQPLSAFKRCGYTKSCQEKCSVDILQFEVEKARVRNPGARVYGQYKTSVPTTFEAIEGMAGVEPFEPITVQQLSDLDEGLGCDRLLVVVGRLIPANDDIGRSRKWVYHSICVKMSAEGVMYMKLHMSGVLEHAHEFFLLSDNTDEAADDSLYSRWDYHQVIDVVVLHERLPGTEFSVLFVAWEKKMYKNGVYLISVDSAGEERAGWVVDSVSVANDRKTGDLRVYDLVFDEEPLDSDDIGDETYPLNPVFTHVSVAPRIDTIEDCRLLFTMTLSVNIGKDRGEEDFQRKSFVGMVAVTDFAATVDVLETWDAPHQSYIHSLGWLAYTKMFGRGSFAVSEYGDSQWGYYYFQNKQDQDRDIMTATQIELKKNATTSTVFLEARGDDDQLALSRFSGGATNIFRDAGLYEFSRDPTTFSSACRARFMFLAYPEVDRNIFKYSSVSCNSVASNDGSAWLNEMRFEKEKATDALWSIAVEDKLQTIENVAVEAECNFMSCFKCTDPELRRRCYAAENCATRRCIATTFNHQNLFCVSGGIVKEAAEYLLVDAKVGFSAFVEFYVGIFSFSQKTLRSQSIDVQSLSDYYTGRFCELKDICAHISAIIPAIFSTVYHVQRLRIESSTRISSRDMDFISPKNQFRVRSLTTYVTEVINSILLGAPHYLYMSAKLILCGSDQLAKLSGGVVNILDNTIGSEETNICIFNSFQTSDSKVPSDNDIIQQNMLRDFGGVPKKVEITRRRNKINRVFVDLASSAPSLALISAKYNQFVMLNQINTAVDWLLGILQSAARLVSAFDPLECRPFASNIRFMAQCVCGDERYEIARHAADKGTEGAALWCSGILEVLDGTGHVKYIYNPYSFAELKQKLDGNSNSLLYQYLDCVGQGNSDCKQLQVNNPVFANWMQNGVNPLSVLTRCRDNFAGKIFDRGAFMIYNEDMQEIIQQQRGHAVTTFDIQALQLQLDGVLDDGTKTCLRDGPTLNSIGTCMFLFFEANARKMDGNPFDTSPSQYFQYIKSSAGENQGHDACGYLSTNSFAEGDDLFSESIRACRGSGSTVCNQEESEISCKVLYNTQTLMSGSSTNVVDTYSTQPSANIDNADNFAHVSTCAGSTMDHYISTATEMLENTEFEFNSAEGDFIHQLIDCVIMGAYDFVEALPADAGMKLESLIYSRDSNYSSRDFELPCEQKTLYGARGEIVESKTCGTSARVSAISYVLAKMRESASSQLDFTRVIKAKLEDVKAELTNVSLYQCSGPCCETWDEATCSAAEVSFAPRFDFDMGIDISDFVQQGIGGIDLQFEAINNVQFWTSYTSQEFNASIQNYNQNLKLLKTEGLSYPVEGVLDYSDTSYEFPLQRSKDPLSIIQQCHSMLRASSRTHDTMFSESGSETFQVIADFLAHGEEWNPTDLQAPKTISRSEIINRILHDEQNNENAISVLHDERYIAQDSSFCSSGRDLSMPDNFLKLDMQDVPDAIQHLNASVGNIAGISDQDTIRLLGFYARAIGDIDRLCPCGLARDQYCHLVINEASLVTDLEGITVLESFDTEKREYKYPEQHALVVRRELQKQKHHRQYDCATQHVSDLTGVLPKNLTAYFLGEHASNTSALDLLLFPKSGISLSNLQQVADLLPRELNEANRLINVTDHENPVHNKICTSTHTEITEATISAHGFPVVTSVAESPAVSACVRFLFEFAWNHMLLQADGIAEAELIESAGKVGLWGSRCQVKLKKLRSCDSLMAFDVEYTKRISYSQREMESCNFTVKAEDATDIALSRGPCLVITGDKRFYDPLMCLNVSDGFEREISKGILVPACEVFSPMSMLRTENDFAFQDAPLLSREFAENVLHNQSYREDMGILGMKRGHDFLFPAAHADGQRQCSVDVAYWPQHWQYPYGEILSGSYDKANAYSSYMAVVVDDEDSSRIEEVATLPNILRPDKISQTQSGSSGFCREPSLGMSVLPTNTHRICAQTGNCKESTLSATSSIKDTCSKTAAARVGTAVGHTIGYVYPMLRPFVGRENTRWGSTPFLTTQLENLHIAVSLLDLYRKYGEDFELDVYEGLLDLNDEVRRACGIEIEHDRDARPRDCWANYQCSEKQTCNFKGECVNVTMSVTNDNTGSGIEFGMTALGAEPRDGREGVAGASPYQRVAGFMQHLGLCSHHDAVTYERQLKSFAKNCQKHTDGQQGGRTWFTCSRAASGNQTTTMNFINHPPGVLLPESPGSRMCGSEPCSRFWLEYSSDVESSEARDVDEIANHIGTEFDYLRLVPHVCDFEYYHSKNLGWVELDNLDRHGAVDYWMRMAKQYDEISLVQRNVTQASPTCSSTFAGNDKCLSSDKMRFLGLEHYDIKFSSDKAPQEIVTDGGNCGLCTPETFSYGGIELNLRLDNTGELKKYENTEHCGSFGNLKPSTTVCELDLDTTPIIPLIYDSNTSCSKLFVDSSMLNEAAHGSIEYDHGDVNAIRNYLNKIFLGKADAFRTSTDHKRTQLVWFRACVLELTDSIKLKKRRLFDRLINATKVGGKAQSKWIHDTVTKIRDYDHIVGGIYMFNQWNSYEVPVMWWEKNTLGVYFFPTEENNQLSLFALDSWSATDSELPQNRLFAWENRLDGNDVSFLGKLNNLNIQRQLQSNRKIRNIWSALNTQQVLPDKQQFVIKFSEIIGEIIADIRRQQTTDAHHYEYGQALKALLAKTSESNLLDYDQGHEQKLSEFVFSLKRRTNMTIGEFKKTLQWQHGKFDYLDQYNRRIFSPTFVHASSTGAGYELFSNLEERLPKDQVSKVSSQFCTFSVSDDTSVDSCKVCNGPQAGVYVPKTLEGSFLSILGQFVALDTNKFASDIIRKSFFEDTSALNVVYFDPLMDAVSFEKKILDELKSLEVAAHVENKIKLNQIPLAIIKIENGNPEQLVQTLLTEKSQLDECTNMAEEESIVIDYQEHATAQQNQRCIWNPRQRRQRKNEAKELKLGENSEPRIVITANGQNFTWSLCELSTPQTAKHGFASVQDSGYSSAVRDGVVCTFSDYVRAENGASAFDNTNCDQIAEPSPFCDHKPTPNHKEVSYEETDRTATSATACNLDEPAKVFTSGIEKELKERNNEFQFVGEMYYDTKSTVGDFKRKRKSLCHRVDHNCVADNKETDSSGGKYKHLFTSTATTAEKHPNKMFFDALKQRNRHQKVTTMPEADSGYIPSWFYFSDPRWSQEKWTPDDIKNGPMCNVDSITVPKGATIKAWKIRDEFLQHGASFADVVFNDRFAFHKKSTNPNTGNSQEQIFFQHHYHEDNKQHTSPTPAHSFCPVSGQRFPSYSDKLQTFKIVDFDIDNLRKRIQKRYKDWDWNLGIDPKTLQATDAGLTTTYPWNFNGIFEEDYDDSDYIHEGLLNEDGMSWEKYYNVKSHQEILESTVRFEEQTTKSFFSGFGAEKTEGDDARLYTCKPPHLKGNAIENQHQPVWDLSTCYQNDFDTDTDDYLWTKQTLCETATRFMEGTLSLHWFQWLMRPYDRETSHILTKPSWRSAFQFSEIMTGSSSTFEPTEGNPTYEYVPGMRAPSWEDEDVVYADPISRNEKQFATLKGPEFLKKHANKFEIPRNDDSGALGQLFGWDPKKLARTVPYIPAFFAPCQRRPKSWHPWRVRHGKESYKHGFQKVLMIGRDQYPYSELEDDWEWAHDEWFDYDSPYMNAFDMCYDEVQAELYIVEEKKDKTGTRLGSIKQGLASNANRKKVAERTKNFWADFVSLRNLKYEENICPCREESPMYRTRGYEFYDSSNQLKTSLKPVSWSKPGLGFGGAIMASYGIYEQRRKVDPVVEFFKNNWWAAALFTPLFGPVALVWAARAGAVSGLLEADCLNKNSKRYKRGHCRNPVDFSESEGECWQEKKNNDDRCDFYDPDLFTRRGDGLLSDGECSIYCSNYAKDDAAISARSKIMSKVIGANLQYSEERSRLDLTPCIHGRVDESDNTMEVSYAMGSFRKDDRGDDGVQSFKSRFGLTEEEGNVKLIRENVARTFLRSFMGKNEQNYENGVCSGGGSKKHLVTKPSFWADVESNPRKIVVPCRPEDKDQNNLCKPILEEVEINLLTASDYEQITHADGSTTLRLKQGATPTSKICSYEISLDDTSQNVTECDYKCSEDQGDCSLHAAESADRCYFDGQHSRSLLRNSISASQDELAQCQSCEQYQTSAEILTALELQNTCLGRGLFLDNSNSAKSNAGVHMASKTIDEGRVDHYVREIQDATKTYLANATHVSSIEGLLKNGLQSASFRMSDEIGVSDNLRFNALHSAEVDIKTYLSGDTYVYVFLNLANETLFKAGTGTKRSRVADGVNGWAQESNNDVCTSAKYSVDSQQCGHASRFKRFDPEDAVINNENIQTDYEDGCTQSVENIESALEYNKCKDPVKHKTIAEMHQILQDVYKKEFGLKVNVIGKKNQSRFVVSPSMRNFSWYRGVLPWFSQDQEFRAGFMDEDEEQAPFLEHVTRDECKREFQRLSVGRSPCFRDFNNTPHILVPFLGETYAWPKGKTSADVDRAFGLSCYPEKAQNNADHLASCLNMVQSRVQDFEKYMIGTDVCFFTETDSVEDVDFYKYRACFASFCTTNSHIGISNIEECINSTHPDQKCVDKGSPLCQCYMTNDYHRNKSICVDSRDINDRIQSELPGRAQMKKIRRLYEDGKFRHYEPTHPRCSKRFQSAKAMEDSLKTCKLVQAPLGFSDADRRTFLLQRYAGTLARTEEISDKMLKRDDAFSIRKLQDGSHRSLWLDDSITKVLGREMKYPAGEGDQLYGLIKLDAEELGPQSIDFQVGEMGLKITTTKLTPDAAGHQQGWMRKIPYSVQRDRDRIRKNPLYSPHPNQTDHKKWVCPYIERALITGNKKLFDNSHVRLLTPNPNTMIKKYPRLNGLHPLAEIRDVDVAAEITHYQHFGMLHTLWSYHDEIDLTKEVEILFDRKTKCHHKTVEEDAEILLGWPHVRHDLRSGEHLAPSATQPHDLKNLSRDFLVSIFHEAELHVDNDTRWMFENHTPYKDGRNYSHRRKTTIDQGSECHKSPLSIIPRKKVQEMMAFDTCFMTSEHKSGRSRTYECQNSTASVFFEFNTTSFLNHRRDLEYHHYSLCRPVPEPRHTIWISANESLLARRPELSISTRKRISPFYKRVNDLRFRNANASINFESLWSQFHVPGTGGQHILPPLLLPDSMLGTEAFDKDWVYRCPPSGDSFTGQVSYADWSSSTDRQDLCLPENVGVDVDTNQCNLAKAVDLCKYPGFEELCTLIRRYRDQITRLNMKKVGLISESAQLYSPSSFYHQENLYAWEIVSRTYDSMNLISSKRDSCQNVHQSVSMIDDAIQNSLSLQSHQCPSQIIKFYVFILAKVRTIAITLAKMGLALVEAVWNLILGIISLLIETAMDVKLVSGESGLVYFVNRAFSLFMECFRLGKQFFENLIMVALRLILENPVARQIIRLISAACKLFKKFVKAILTFAQTIISNVQKILNKIGIKVRWGGAIRKLEDEKEKVDLWSCTFDADEACKRHRCKRRIQTMIADTCYDDLVGGADALQGTTNAIEASSTTWVGVGRGSFACDDLSYCRDGLGIIKYCNECGPETSVLPEYHCGIDSKCACGTKPAQSSICYLTADCTPTTSCQEVYKGFDVSSSSSSCQTNAAEAVTCLRANTADTVGRCTKILGYDFSDDCDQTFANIDGFCFVMPNTIGVEIAQGSEVFAADLFSVPCSTLTLQESRSMQVLFGASIEKCSQVYSQDSPVQFRRLLQEPSPSTGIHQERPYNSVLAEFVKTMQPRMHTIQGPCGDIFARKLNTTETVQGAIWCAQVLLVLNTTLAGTNVSDQDMLNMKNATRIIYENPDILFNMVSNIPQAVSTVAADYLGAHDKAQIGHKTLRFWYEGISDMVSEARSVFLAVNKNTTAARAKPSTGELNASNALFTAALHAIAGQEDAKNRSSQPRRKLLQISSSDLEQFQREVDQESNAWAARWHQSTFQRPECAPFAQSRVFSFLASNLGRSLQRYGWEQIETCSGSAREQFLVFVAQTCPAAETVLWTVINNTITLVEYYKHLQDVGCLTNSSISCLKPAENSHKTPASAFPRIKREKVPTNAHFQNNDTEPLLSSFIDILKTGLDFIDLGETSREEILWGFLSVDAAYNDDEYNLQASKNEFSLGRVAREFFTCDLKESLECSKVRSPLIPVFVAVFVFIFLITFFAPIPSVVTFFLWTLGLTYGVTYIAYAFSPLCWPRIPVCLGEGLYEVVNEIFPAQISFAPELKSPGACSAFHVDSSMQFIIAVETFYRGGPALTTRSALEQCHKRIELKLCKDELAKVQLIADNLENPESRTAMYYCTFFSSYRILAVSCLFIFFAPILLYIIALVLPLFLHLCSISINSVIFLVQVNSGNHEEDS